MSAFRCLTDLHTGFTPATSSSTLCCSMAFDVFISYAHQDKALADATCAKLESEGVRCWQAPRDIAPGADWAASIVDAIESCRVMVLIFSGHTNRSRQVSREVQQAFDRERPVVPFRIENVAPEKSLRYYMDSVHWLDALTPPVEQHIQRLASAVQALLNATQPDADDRMPREAEAGRVTEQEHVEEKQRAKASAELTRAEAESASRPATRWIWKAAVIFGLLIISSAISCYVWWSPFTSAKTYAAIGNFACFDKAEYPDSWRAEAPLCAPYGCNFGKMSQEACLTLGARKQSKTVIHGNTGTTRTNECWLQNSCGNLQPHSEFTLFRM
jgi:TIR domain